MKRTIDEINLKNKRRTSQSSAIGVIQSRTTRRAL
jgi:hypothetical protein